ncbi:hypothetical protein [Bacteroides sp. 519]|uniref:hypothetical protein n=1 Tax=Bacteroides sp. 519 TaxID=2302937 RepID=UPI0013D405DA|nr:hypothetical protein [Bacteroides sp. 519]NDV57195.1 hypothetical protein [Bacteroides sp. 519]
MKHLLIIFGCLYLLFSCDIPQARTDDDEISELLPVNTNFELLADTFLLEQEFGTESNVELHKGDQVVVAEFSKLTTEDAEFTMIKVANSQEKQGWVVHSMLLDDFVPVDSISQIIHFMSNRYLIYSVISIAFLFLLLLIVPAIKKRIPFIVLNDIDSLYPLLFCLLVSICAVAYQSIQLFTPTNWLYYYFNPSLSPSGQPLLLSLFLISLWLILIVLIAVIDVAFKHLSSAQAFIYLSGIIFAGICCYAFFILTTSLYIGYLFITAFICYFMYRLFKDLHYNFRCGNCGQKMKARGECPHCGGVNK